MPYSATIISSAVQGGGFREITIDYVNSGNPTVRDTVRSAQPSLAWLQAVVRDRLAQLDQMTAFVPPPGSFVPPTLDPPTQFELDRNVWRQNLSRLRIALVVFDPTHLVVTNLKTTLTTTYQNGFLD